MIVFIVIVPSTIICDIPFYLIHLYNPLVTEKLNYKSLQTQSSEGICNWNRRHSFSCLSICSHFVYSNSVYSFSQTRLWEPSNYWNRKTPQPSVNCFIWRQKIRRCLDYLLGLCSKLSLKMNVIGCFSK